MKKATQESNISAEDTYAKEQETLANTRKTQLENEAAEKIAVETDSFNRYKAIEDTSFAKQKEYDAAAIAAAQAKAIEAENAAEVQNDVARQQAAVSLNKLGLVMSTAGINLIQSTHAQGALKLAALRSENAFKVAGLQIDANKAETAHALKINSAIDTAKRNTVSYKETASEKIYAIQNDLTKTKLEKDRAISKLKDDYYDFRVKTKKDIYDVTLKANEDLAKETERLQKMVDAKKAEAKKEASSLISSGKWQSMTPTQKAYYEQRAGVQPGAMEAEVNAQITTKMNAGLEFFTKAFGVNLSDVDSETLAKAQREVMGRMKLGYDIDTAVMYGLSIIKNSPKFKEFSDMATAGSKFAKAQADIAAKQAQAELTKAKTITELLRPDEIKARISKAKRSGTASPGGKLSNLQV